METRFENLTENELVEQARTGDTAAFEQLLLRYERRIYNYILRLVRHPHDAQDLTQEAFLKLYKNIRYADAHKNFKSWLFTIATNTVYDWLRKQRKISVVTSLEAFETSPETFEGCQAYYYIDTESQDIGRALATLRPVYATVLLLYYKYGFTYDEIATILDCPLNTVKTYLSRAKQLLSERFRKG